MLFFINLDKEKQRDGGLSWINIFLRHSIIGTYYWWGTLWAIKNYILFFQLSLKSQGHTCLYNLLMFINIWMTRSSCMCCLNHLPLIICALLAIKLLKISILHKLMNKKNINLECFTQDKFVNLNKLKKCKINFKLKRKTLIINSFMHAIINSFV